MDDDGDKRDSSQEDPEADRVEGNRLIVSGAGLGALGAASAVVLGATCPLCVVGAPALVGFGFYKRWRASKGAASAETTETTETTASADAAPDHG